MSRKHLSIEAREIIAEMLAYGHTQEQMAQAVSVSQSTISREISRNRKTGRYRPVQAHRMACRRRQKASADRHRKLEQPKLLKYVKTGLKKFWSPQQIAGRLERQHHCRPVSHQTIYQWIKQAKEDGRKWHIYLRQSNRKYKRRSRGKADNRGKIPDRTFIDQRPAAVETRRQFGHWEGDTLVGKNHKGGVVTHVERKSRYLVMAPLPVRDHRQLVKASRRAFARHDHDILLPRKSETLDNGQEFWSHKELGKALGLDIYFARPYHPWERGTNEQVNGLIRQFLPKGCELTNLSSAKIRRIEELLNNRPRKTLGYRTPIEVLRTHRIYAFRI
ncbi:MAG: IS30 family transposase [Planctomycetaceae bacterium]|nr:MAG: IS30 family transposase [Planctomycetaceae bacterium]